MRSLRDVSEWVQRAEEGELSMKTIFARKPWTIDAEAKVVPLDDESRAPSEAVAGMEYFLEASVAREVLEGLAARPSGTSSAAGCKLLIYYAENDAYPEWVYGD